MDSRLITASFVRPWYPIIASIRKREEKGLIWKPGTQDEGENSASDSIAPPFLVSWLLN
jgi:hypothetical protein